MPVSIAIRDRVRPFLPPDEGIRYIFPAAWVGGMSHFFVAVTESAVTVVAMGTFSHTKPKTVWHTFVRNTRIGPVYMAPMPLFMLGGKEFEMDEEYVAVVNAADAEISSSDAMPPDPLADL